MDFKPDSLDFRHLDLHTDCVALEYRYRILAVTCYQLDESSPTDSQVRAGSVNFYTLKASDTGKTALQDVKVQFGGDATLSTHLTCPAGVFDIRWSLNVASGTSSPAILNLALSDGSLRRYEISPVSSENSSPHAQTVSYEYVAVKELVELPSESDGDLAIGVDVALISEFSLIDEDDDEDAPNDSSAASPGSDAPKQSPSELAAVGYQTGALAVFDLGSNSISPMWSSSDAHMAEIWQTQWIHDSSYDAAAIASAPGSLGLTTEAYGRKVGSLFLSGSDDCSLKMWDVRRNPESGAVAENRKHYAMGVTSFASPMASPCRLARRLLPNCVLVGSYDESLSVWDLRRLARPVSSINLGGGVWRLRWLPSLELFNSDHNAPETQESGDAAYLAVAAMHAGFKVVKVTQSGAMEALPSGVQVEETSSYWGPHKGSADNKFPPLAYGIDWAVAPRSSIQTGLVASCTFYDNCVSLWKP